MTLRKAPAASSAGSAVQSEIWRRRVDFWGPFVTIAILLAIWEAASQMRLVTPFLLPAVSTVLARIATDFASGKLLIDVGMTLYRTLAGFGIAAICGVILGLLIARVAGLRWFFDPVVSAGLPIPKIALMPVFMLWFGLFDASKIAMVVFSAIFQIIIATWWAAHSVEKELVWSARSLGASERQILFEVTLPAAAPQIFTGLQVAFPLCLIVTLVTEMLMGGEGIGDTMLQNARYVDSPGLFAGIFIIGAVGYICIALLEWLRRRLLGWQAAGGASE
ncbi:MAG: ABC transporter permease [Alphaproteobacteria bacterium]|nr:ABC transporter permease [Alphaproteobacteria bacterium]